MRERGARGDLAHADVPPRKSRGAKQPGQGCLTRMAEDGQTHTSKQASKKERDHRDKICAAQKKKGEREQRRTYDTAKKRRKKMGRGEERARRRRKE